MLKKYEEDGFQVSEEPIVLTDLIEAVQIGTEGVMSGKYDTGIAPPKSRWSPGNDLTVLRKINMPQISCTAFRRLMNQRELGDFAHEVTGAEHIQVWWSQLIYKPPEQADWAGVNEVTCHQDSTYELDWSPDSHLFTMWIALSDVFEDSGPLQYLRGSHHLGGVKRDIPYLERYQENQEYNPYLDDRFEEVSVVLQKGQVSCHHRHIYHGSGPNRRNVPRVSVALHLCADGSKVVNRNMYTEHLDNLDFCPVIRGDADKARA